MDIKRGEVNEERERELRNIAISSIHRLALRLRERIEAGSGLWRLRLESSISRRVELAWLSWAMMNAAGHCAAYF